MRFALLGTHPDGLEMACALVATGRHQLAAYTGRPIPPAVLARWGDSAEAIGDLEEVLANPAIEAVIVAGAPAYRAAQLRRALQSERHVLCVYPPDRTPDIAYEAAMIQADTARVLFPILSAALHPAVVRFAERAHSTGTIQLLEVEHASAAEFLLEPDPSSPKWSMPGWDRLRAIGGEIAEVSALASRDALEPGQPLLLSGIFAHGGLFHVSFIPIFQRPLWRANALGERGRIELLFPAGLQGPAFLTGRDERGESPEEYFPAWDPWPPLVAAFEQSLMGERASRTDAKPQRENAERIVPAPDIRVPAPSPLGAFAPLREPPTAPTWQDVIRALELDDAARRSVAKRRSSTLEYPEPTEETGFKGTMTLVGCGLFWLVLLLLILSAWKPWLGWFIPPILILFLALQVFRWVVRRRRDDA